MFKLTPKYKSLLLKIFKVIIVFLLVLFVLTKLIGYVAPFIIALMITYAIEQPVQLLRRKLKMPRGMAVAISLFAFVLLVGGALVLLFYNITLELWRLTKEINIAVLQDYLEYFENLLDKGQDYFSNLPEGYIHIIEKNLGSIQDNIGALISQIPAWITSLFNSMMNIIKLLPEALVFILITLVATFLMSKDREKISNFVFKQLPMSWTERIRTIKGDLFVALVGFLKAQLILITLTFIELFIGYTILGVKYAFFFALLTALVDALPILGTGTVLIPTAIVHFILGNFPRGLAFIVLYLVILAVRQFLEPRVVGESIGLHPLVTLITIYLGLQLFGVLGLFLGPLLAIIIKAFQKAKILPQWKS